MANYSDIRYKRPSMGLKKGNKDITEIKSDNDDLIIETKVSDKDIHFKGSDDGSVITALTLDMSDGGSASFNHNVTVGGNLTVNGTTTTVNSTTLTVDDKNIELGSTASPSDTSADGGGITLKGSTDHTFNWVNSTDAWTSSEHINLASGKEFKINGTSLKDVSETLTNKTIDASSNTITGISSDLVNDTTPQLGGNLDLNSNNISGTGSISCSGDLTVDTNTLYVDATNNRVGIGTSSPNTNLEIKADSNLTTDFPLRITNSAGSGYTDFGAYAIDTSAVDLVLKAGGNTSITIDKDNGNVGIGTSSPDRLFEVEETSGDAHIRLRAQDTSGGADTIFENLCADNGQNNYIFFGDLDDTNIGIIRYNHGSDFMSFTANASEHMRITSAGRVGIGTTSPAGKFAVSDGTVTIDVNPTSSLGYLGTRTNHPIAFTVNAVEEMRLEADGDLHVDGDVIAYSTTVSDVALKTDIQMIPNALDKIDEVRGVTFTRHNGQKSAGIIAQELEKVLPEAVREKELKLVDGKKYKTVEYDAIHGLLINCIKELKEEIKELKNAFTK